MTRTEYLTQLELYLKKLPEADRIEAMDYFRELFDDAGVEGEEELIASLGTPKEAAHEVLSNLLDKKINEAPAQKNNRQILHIALLALLAAPIGIPLGIAILVTLFAILVAALTVILAFFAVSILGIIGGFLFLVESFTVLAQAKSAFILIFGSGLLAIGASSLVLLGISYQNDRTLSLTDKKLSETPFLSSGIGGILHIASSYSSRFEEVILRLPKGRTLKGINISANRGQTTIINASLENATLNTNSYILRIEGSRIKNSKLTTPNIVNIFDTVLTDSQLESTENHFHAENIQVHGKVELTAKDYLRIILDQKESQRINWDISSNYGSIFQFTREKPESRGTELSNPYKTEKTDVKDQLIARSDDNIDLISTPSRR